MPSIGGESPPASPPDAPPSLSLAAPSPRSAPPPGSATAAAAAAAAAAQEDLFGIGGIAEPRLPRLVLPSSPRPMAGGGSGAALSSTAAAAAAAAAGAGSVPATHKGMHGLVRTSLLPPQADRQAVAHVSELLSDHLGEPALLASPPTSPRPGLARTSSGPAPAPSPRRLSPLRGVGATAASSSAMAEAGGPAPGRHVSFASPPHGVGTSTAGAATAAGGGGEGPSSAMLAGAQGQGQAGPSPVGLAALLRPQDQRRFGPLRLYAPRQPAVPEAAPLPLASMAQPGSAAALGLPAPEPPHSLRLPHPALPPIITSPRQGNGAAKGGAQGSAGPVAGAGAAAATAAEQQAGGSPGSSPSGGRSASPFAPHTHPHIASQPTPAPTLPHWAPLDGDPQPLIPSSPPYGSPPAPLQMPMPVPETVIGVGGGLGGALSGAPSAPVLSATAAQPAAAGDSTGGGRSWEEGAVPGELTTAVPLQLGFLGGSEGQALAGRPPLPLGRLASTQLDGLRLGDVPALPEDGAVPEGSRQLPGGQYACGLEGFVAPHDYSCQLCKRACSGSCSVQGLPAQLTPSFYCSLCRCSAGAALVPGRPHPLPALAC